MKNNIKTRALAKRARRSKQGGSRNVVIPQCDMSHTAKEYREFVAILQEPLAELEAAQSLAAKVQKLAEYVAKCDIADIEERLPKLRRLAELQIELNRTGHQILAHDNMLHIEPIPGWESPL